MSNNISSASNFISIHKKFIQRQKRLHSIKQKIFKKVIRMTPMTKNENLISFDKRLLKSTKQFKMQFVTLLCYYIIMLLHC